MKHAFALLVVTATAVSLAIGGGTSRAAAAPDHRSMAMSPASADPGGASRHSEADVRFIQVLMVRHHHGTRMARLASAHASTQQVKRLAAAIEGAQGSEIETMTVLMRSWRARGAGPQSEGSRSVRHSATAVKKLAALSGTSFDKAFLQMMIRHHQDAVALARAERAHGNCSATKALAASIVDTHTAQISKMRRLLSRM